MAKTTIWIRLEIDIDHDKEADVNKLVENVVEEIKESVNFDSNEYIKLVNKEILEFEHYTEM